MRLVLEDGVGDTLRKGTLQEGFLEAEKEAVIIPQFDEFYDLKRMTEVFSRNSVGYAGAPALCKVMYRAVWRSGDLRYFRRNYDPFKDIREIIS